MAVQFMDGCGHYDLTTFIPLKWQGGGIGVISSTNGRTGRGLQFSNSGGLNKSLSYQSGWVVGWAINIGGTPTSFGNGAYYTASHAGDTTLFTVYSEGDGSVSLYAGNGRVNLIGNSGATGKFLNENIWQWFDVKYSFSGAGTATVSVTATFRVNTQVWISGAASCGITANNLLLQFAKTNNHSFFNPSSGVTYMDSFVIADQSGSGLVNDFFGDTDVGEGVFPRADVATPTWTAVGGTSTTMWDHVNDQFAETNDDTIYIDSGTASQTANMQWQPVPTSDPILAVHYGVLARKDQEGSRTFEQTVGPSGAFTQVGPTIYPGDTYSYYFFAMDTDPNTGIAWTPSSFNSTDFGVKLLT